MGQIIVDKKDINIISIINNIGDRVDKAIKNRDDREYLECLLILYNLIEYMLKWAVFFEGLWRYADTTSNQKNFHKQWGEWQNFCSKRMQFYTANNIAMSMGIIDFQMYQRLDDIRAKRNDLIHKLIIHTQTKNAKDMHTKLTNASDIAKKLAEIVDDLIIKIGFDEITHYLI